MSGDIDIIGGVDSRNDILSGTSSAIAAVAGHLDALHRSNAPLAQEMERMIERHLSGILAATLALVRTPDDASARAAQKKHGIALHRYGTEAGDLLERLGEAGPE